MNLYKVKYDDDFIVKSIEKYDDYGILPDYKQLSIIREGFCAQIVNECVEAFINMEFNFNNSSLGVKYTRLRSIYNQSKDLLREEKINKILE